MLAGVLLDAIFLRQFEVRSSASGEDGGGIERRMSPRKVAG